MREVKNKILIGVPCKNEENNIFNFSKELRNYIQEIKNYEFIILFLDDGSSDNTWKVLESISLNDKGIKIAKFSKNFGKEQALKYLISYASEYHFDYFIPMDADLQYPPNLIHKLINDIELNKVDMVLTTKVNEKKGFLRFIFTKIFYLIYNFFSSSQIIENLSDYSIINNSVINILNNLNGHSFIYKASLQSINCKYNILQFEVPVRNSGKSKFNFMSLAKYSLQIFINYNSSFVLKFVFYFTIIFYLLLLIFLISSYFLLLLGLTNMILVSIILIFLWLSVVTLMITLYIYKVLLNFDSKSSYLIVKDPD